MNLPVNKYKATIFIFLILIFFYFEYVYKVFVFSQYEYLGFTYSFEFFKYLETKLLFFGVLAVIFIKTPSKFLFSIEVTFFLFMFIPILVIYEYIPSPRFIVYSMAFFLVLMHLSAYVKLNISYPKINEKQTLYLVVALALILIIPIVARYKFALNFNVLKFQDIYDVRAKANEGISAIVGYSYSWMVKVILPVLVVLSIVKKRKILSLFGLIILLYLFMVQAQKSVFFSIIVVLVFYSFKDYYKKIAIFVASIFIVFVLTHLVTVFMGNIMPESVVVRRVFFVPALLNTFYLDFFRENYLYLSHSIFSMWFDYPYNLSPECVIGENYYLHSAATHANNGFISDGFMNFGYVGTIVYATLIVALFKIFDTMRISSRYFGVFFIMIFTLISSAFLTTLLTHGALFLLLIGGLIMQENKN